MLDEEGAKNLFEQVDKLWIQAEILRRRQNDSLPDAFKRSRFLVKFPKDSHPIVQFNDEIGWIAKVNTAPSAIRHVGQFVFLHEVREIVSSCALEPHYPRSKARPRAACGPTRGRVGEHLLGGRMGEIRGTGL